MNRKTIIALSITGGVLLIGGVFIYPATLRVIIRKRLDEAYTNPSDKDSVGGLDKLLVQEIFDTSLFEKSGKATISRVIAREKAEQVWENYSTWMSSDSTAIISAFNGLGHVHDISKIAYEFKQAYDYELLSVLKDALSESSQYTILIGKISNLPIT
jgi:hypothetical protein